MVIDQDGGESVDHWLTVFLNQAQLPLGVFLQGISLDPPRSVGGLIRHHFVRHGTAGVVSIDVPGRLTFATLAWLAEHRPGSIDTTDDTTGSRLAVDAGSVLWVEKEPVSSDDWRFGDEEAPAIRAPGFAIQLTGRDIPDLTHAYGIRLPCITMDAQARIEPIVLLSRNPGTNRSTGGTIVQRRQDLAVTAEQHREPSFVVRRPIANQITAANIDRVLGDRTGDPDNIFWPAFEVKGEIHWHPQEPLDEFAFLLQKTVGEGLYHRYVASAVADEVISEEGRRVSSLFDVGVIAQSMPYVTVDEERPDAFELVIFDRRKRELRVLASLTLPESGIENAADSSVEEKVQNWAYGVLRTYRWRDAGMVLQRNSTKVRFVTQIPYRTRLTDPGPSVAAGLNHADGTGFIPGTQTALRQRVGVLADSDNTIAPVAAWPVHPGNVISRDPTGAISPNNEKS